LNFFFAPWHLRAFALKSWLAASSDLILKFSSNCPEVCGSTQGHRLTQINTDKGMDDEHQKGDPITHDMIGGGV
jgi:hypothetical protein